MAKIDPKSAKRIDPFAQERPRWLAEVSIHDYAAALDYLTLIMEPDVAAIIVDQLRAQDKIIKRKAKDLLRAAELPLLDRADEYVMHDLAKVAKRIKMSPVLYLRGNVKRPAIVADGYHRICAAHYCDPDTDVPLKIV